MPAGDRDATRPTADRVVATAQLACLLEASAPKPGNVSAAPGSAFHDVRYEDFLASAAALGPVMLRVRRRPLGRSIREAITATRDWTRSNTNLGIVLLLVPLARAALDPKPGTLRQRTARILRATTTRDAEDVYAAIRLAQPGGLGRADAQDVATMPTIPLVDAMRLAADRDGVAREYATDFAATFEVGAPALLAARCDQLPWADAVVETYLTLLAAFPDTHIARRVGFDAAADVSRRARRVLDRGGVRTADGRQETADLDRDLRDVQNSRNPGTTADLTAASIFAALLDGAWS